MRKTNENILEHYFRDYRDTGNQTAYDKNNGISYTNAVSSSFVSDKGGEVYCISEKMMYPVLLI